MQTVVEDNFEKYTGRAQHLAIERGPVHPPGSAKHIYAYPALAFWHSFSNLVKALASYVRHYHKSQSHTWISKIDYLSSLVLDKAGSFTEHWPCRSKDTVSRYRDAVQHVAEHHNLEDFHDLSLRTFSLLQEIDQQQRREANQSYSICLAEVLVGGG